MHQYIQVFLTLSRTSIVFANSITHVHRQSLIAHLVPGSLCFWKMADLPPKDAISSVVDTDSLGSYCMDLRKDLEDLEQLCAQARPYLALYGVKASEELLSLAYRELPFHEDISTYYRRARGPIYEMLKKMLDVPKHILDEWSQEVYETDIAGLRVWFTSVSHSDDSDPAKRAPEELPKSAVPKLQRGESPQLKCSVSPLSASTSFECSFDCKAPRTREEILMLTCKKRVLPKSWTTTELTDEDERFNYKTRRMRV
ncbi:hypothetical protein NM688_g7266 [Phlebia brevispora]|uniref:Uncharacterized protein n=1 Tax=Phlebia brevispora TaxID=194682 RepID=A0ACC1S771_9APHY|nr:hypothetical protein NM688_g7266 [Phlebia brevispora]